MATKDVSEEKLSTLLKDGISEELFKLLWAKDELNYGPSINIPDTIVYKYGQPICWYFTSVSGKVKKKNKTNLISAKIEEAFNKHVLGYDVLAQFISIPSEREAESNTSEVDQHVNIINYFDRDALNKFLYTQKKDVHGILQRFIEPKTTRNEIVRAIWSPKVCLLERVENIHQLHDHRYGLYERCVLYEGPEYYTTSAPLRGPVLSGQIQKICESIISHISEVTYGQKQVSRIVINYKVDSRDKIWLLYSTSIRCVDMLEYKSAAEADKRHLVNIDSVVSLSSMVHLNPTKTYEKIAPKKWIRCLSCAKDTLDDLRHPITYKVIIKHYEHVLHILGADKSVAGTGIINWPPDAEVVEAAGGVGFGCLYINESGDLMNPLEIAHSTKLKDMKELQIPPILHNIHYKLSLQSYHRCKHDPLFLFKTVLVCEPCYLVFAEFMTMLLRMGQDLTKLLTHDPTAVIVTNNSFNQTTKSSSLGRPSSADWREVSSFNTSSKLLKKSQSAGGGEFHRSSNHMHARESAIGLRSDERHQPDLPYVVRDSNTSASVVLNTIHTQNNHDQYSYNSSNVSSPTKQHNQQHQIITGSALEQGSITSAYNADEVKSSIAERERHFFKEISLNPNLKDQHPLMHLINAQQKLKLVDQQSGVLSSKAANKTESIFGTRYGKQTTDAFHKNAAYGSEIPYIISGKIILPSKLKLQKLELSKKKKQKQMNTLKAILNEDGNIIGTESIHGTQTIGFENHEIGNDSILTGDSIIKSSTLHSINPSQSHPSQTSAIISKPKFSSGGGTQTESILKSSLKHRDFLAEQLKRIENIMGSSTKYIGQYSGAIDDPFINKDQAKRTLQHAMTKKTVILDSLQSNNNSITSNSLQNPSLTTEVLNETLFEGSTESALLRELGLNEAQRSLTIEEASLEKQIIIEEANALRELVNKK